MKRTRYPNATITKEAGLNFSTIAITAYRLAFGPPGMPAPIVKKLEGAFYDMIKDPDFVEWSKTTRSVIAPMNSKECTEYVVNVEKEVLKYADKLKTSK